MCQAYLHLSSGEPGAAIERLQALHRAASEIGDTSGLLAGMGFLAQAYLVEGARAQARHWAEQALRMSRSGPMSGLGVYDGCLAPRRYCARWRGRSRNRSSGAA